MYKFRVGEFALPEFEALNNYAQFDYQRERVYVRTNSYLKKYYAKSASLPRKNLYVYTGNVNISLPAPKKEPCPLCNKNTSKTSENLSKKIVDLKFFRSGVKRWIFTGELKSVLLRSMQKNI